jgi:RAD51-like protein 2
LFTKRGFISTSELEESRNHKQGGLANLAAELGVELPHAARLWREVQDSHTNEESPTTTASQLLQQQAQHTRNHIVTFAKDVDSLLGGGIPLGHLTEIAGLPGTGKTQLAMQLAVLVRLPTIFGGVQGSTLYIDSEGSFSPERCYQMSHALIKHVQGTCQRRPHIQNNSQISLTEQTLLESIQVFRVHDETCQTATIQRLQEYITNHHHQHQQQQEEETKIKLIVIDSIAFHYRAITPTSPNYYLERTKQLTSLASHLSDLAQTHHLAVVCINQMTTKLFPDKSSTMVPALGESWAHSVTTRLLLEQSTNNTSHRTCTLVKSPHRPSGKAHFQVLPQGIRGMTKKSPPNTNTNTNTNNDDAPLPSTVTPHRFRTDTQNNENQSKRLRTN